ncbi:hypothetical protein OVY01_00140 [Robbsia sp. Bb-Pol-6]|uniref:Uncharacterized protein n=1 Tax=Robbsia betulipollinis TaxID=2981849 RepID=A0ABT3ZGM0_9BURK|nr:hypothetical protein [Robbsia betulipollinis]MCY0385674.1 hypothetical protein [Robbsia betulipollinis]
MTAILSLLSGGWTGLISLLGMLVATAVAVFKHQEAKTAKANEATQVEVAAAATDKAAEAVSDAAGARAALATVTQAASVRQTIEAGNATLAKTPGALDQAMIDKGYTE